jgi:hypothetical protein
MHKDHADLYFRAFTVNARSKECNIIICQSSGKTEARCIDEATASSPATHQCVKVASEGAKGRPGRGSKQRQDLLVNLYILKPHGLVPNATAASRKTSQMELRMYQCSQLSIARHLQHVRWTRKRIHVCSMLDSSCIQSG